jgi:hypothetical protein
MRLCFDDYVLVLLYWTAHDSSVRLPYSRSRLFVTGIAISYCGRLWKRLRRAGRPGSPTLSQRARKDGPPWIRAGVRKVDQRPTQRLCRPFGTRFLFSPFTPDLRPGLLYPAASRLGFGGTQSLRFLQSGSADTICARSQLQAFSSCRPRTCVPSAGSGYRMPSLRDWSAVVCGRAAKPELHRSFGPQEDAGLRMTTRLFAFHNIGDICYSAFRL